MLKGGRCNQAIDIGEGYAFTLCPRGENGPAVGDSLGDRKQAHLKRRDQILLPLFQLSPPLAGWQQFNPSADFSEGQDAGEKRLFRSGLQPAINALIRLPRACKLGEDVGVEQKGCHKSTGLGWSFCVSRFSSAPAKGGCVRRS